MSNNFRLNNNEITNLPQLQAQKQRLGALASQHALLFVTMYPNQSYGIFLESLTY